MSFFAELVAHLVADAGVTALVAVDHITPIVRPQGQALPGITYQIISGTPANSLDGHTSGMTHIRVQIDAWADDYDEARAIAAAVKSRMNTVAATFRSLLLFDQDLFEDSTRIYRVLMDFSCWHHE